jgi:hypothetical protein
MLEEGLNRKRAEEPKEAKAKAPPMPMELTEAQRAIAVALCAAEFCGCDEDWAPCKRACEMAVLAIQALDGAGVSEWDINSLLSGAVSTCDGWCHDGCGGY